MMKHSEIINIAIIKDRTLSSKKFKDRPTVLYCLRQTTKRQDNFNV